MAQIVGEGPNEPPRLRGPDANRLVGRAGGEPSSAERDRGRLRPLMLEGLPHPPGGDVDEPGSGAIEDHGERSVGGELSTRRVLDPGNRRASPTRPNQPDPSVAAGEERGAIGRERRLSRRLAARDRSHRSPRNRVGSDHLPLRRCRDDPVPAEDRAEQRLAETNDRTDARLAQRAPKSVLGAVGGSEPSRLPRQDEAQLRIGPELRDRERLELMGARLARLGPGLAPLQKRVHGDCCHRGEEHRADGDDRDESPMPAVGVDPLALELPVGLMASPPREHRLCEHVVEDLVPKGSPLLERAQDPAPRQRREHGSELLLRDSSEVDEIVELVRDLRARRRHEMVEESSCDVLLVGTEHRHRALEMLLDDLLRAAEPLERLEPQHVRAT